MACNMLQIYYKDCALLHIFSLDSVNVKSKIFQVKVSSWPLPHTPEISLKLVQNLEECSSRSY
jgi:hypothetical protein